jgi:hypothetical protein
MSVSQTFSNQPHKNNAYPGIESALQYGMESVGSVLDHPTSESCYQSGNFYTFLLERSAN